MWMVIEDGPVEDATAIAYLVAASIGLVSAYRCFSTSKVDYGIVLLALAGAFFVVGMEEISWGQRLIGFETPSIVARHNAQGELSLHNLGGFQQRFLHPAYMLIGFAGSFGPLLIPSFISTRLPVFWRSMLPSPQLFFYFFPAFAFYFVNDLIHPYTRNGILDWLRVLIGTGDRGYDNGGWWIHQEPVELILSVGFLLLTLQILSGVPRGNEDVLITQSTH